MLAPTDPSQMAEPSQESVGNSIEFPTLKANLKIAKIIWVNSQDQASKGHIGRAKVTFCFWVKAHRINDNERNRPPTAPTLE